MADHENFHSQTHGPTTQFLSLPVSVLQAKRYYIQLKILNTVLAWNWLRQTHDLLVIAVLCKVVRCGASQHNSAPKAKHLQHRARTEKPTDPTGSHRIPQEFHDFMLFRSCSGVKTVNMSTILSHVSENHLVEFNSCNLLWICAGFKVVKRWGPERWDPEIERLWDMRLGPSWKAALWQNTVSTLTWKKYKLMSFNLNSLSAKQSTARVGSQSHLERVSSQAVLSLRADGTICIM